MGKQSGDAVAHFLHLSNMCTNRSVYMNNFKVGAFQETTVFVFVSYFLGVFSAFSSFHAVYFIASLSVSHKLLKEFNMKVLPGAKEALH